MPIADLLGGQFDMQLVVKLSISVAAVVLVSLAYKFYRSRDAEKIQLYVKDEKEPESSTCRKCKTTLQCQGSHDTDYEGECPRPLDADSAADELTSDIAGETPAEARAQQTRYSEDEFSVPHSEKDNSIKGAILTHRKQAGVTTSNLSFGPALNLPFPTENGTASPTGRRSPCFLQKLDSSSSSVGVGRELRQDLEHQGSYSSFLSKAEIKVEDANVVLEGTGDQIVRGKIYDYYVESSSHSITDSNAALGQFERNSESPPGEFRSRGSSPTESPSSVSPIIIRDLVLPQCSDEEDQPMLGGLKLRHPTRPLLIRKESYLSAAEQSEYYIPSLTSNASNSTAHTPASTSSGSSPDRPTIFPQTESEGLNVNDGETAAGAPLSHPPVKSPDSTHLEGLKNKVDLGNCLETLCVAKKHGRTSEQEAALGVMSDNYLQVLKDPNLYGRLMAGEREQIQTQRMRGRQVLMVADMDPPDWARNAGGRSTETERRKTSSALYYYDDYKDAWHTLCPIPEEAVSKACAMCTMDNYLFVAVGCQGTDTEMTPSNRVFCYNPLTSIWKEISPMNEARPRCKLAALEGFIYAIGGECLSSVERYDPRLDRWTFVAPLPNETFAVAHDVTVCSGDIFVSGGSLRCMLLRYSPKTNSWRPGLLMGREDRTADMVSVGRFLYRFDVNPLLGLSVYRYHTVARLWYECSTKRIQHCPSFRCVAVDHTVYCVSRQFTMRFQADEISPGFTDENLSVLPAAKGMLFPFVLSLPDKKPRQTSV